NRILDKLTNTIDVGLQRQLQINHIGEILPIVWMEVSRG
ncbi:unnamed protein product, partial [marine sediment metagenome]